MSQHDTQKLDRLLFEIYSGNCPAPYPMTYRGLVEYHQKIAGDAIAEMKLIAATPALDSWPQEDTAEHKAYRRGFTHGHDMGRASAVQAAEVEPADGMGIPLSCGKPLCAPGEHHPLCKLAASVEQAAQSDGRGTDAQIERERDIARHAIVGALAAGHAGQDHPGADHWLAAAHDAGARIKELEAQVTQADPDDRAMLDVINERDRCHEWADKLSAAIAEHTGQDIGEHSSANNPWSAALEALEADAAQGEPVLSYFKDEDCVKFGCTKALPRTGNGWGSLYAFPTPPTAVAQGAGEAANFVVSAVVIKDTVTGFNTQNKLYGVDAASREEAHGKVLHLLEVDFPEHRLHTVCSYQLSPPAQPAPVVPEGWKLVPIKCTVAMKDVGGQFEFATIADGRLLAQSMWNELLLATPTPPAQAAADARDAILFESSRWGGADCRLAVWESLRILGSRMGVTVTKEDQYTALATHQQGGK